MQAGTSETHLGPSPSHPVDTVCFAPGTMLAGRYRIVARLGRGGMGEVYRADDLRLGQPVALKFLPTTLEQDPAARERLFAEVRHARTVSHPNVCRVYDIGEEQGRYFLTMEYIDGEDLASLLRRIGRLPPAKALEIARQLCAGLAAAHERGVLHRDLKPANVMIDGRGRARLTDFGLAIEAEPAGGALYPGTTPGVRPRAQAGPADAGPNEVVGTIPYLAPERFDGKPATVQSDLYALGLVLYETYTGKQAVSATTLDGWRQAHRHSTPSHPSALVTDIEPAVERAILRCLEKDPEKRPSSAAQLAATLPGGDPLAAAIAAGETPSPELVAASGEEGTLPRAKAWVWFVSCLAAMAVALPLGNLWQLANLVPLPNPAVQLATARRVLASIGYRNRPADAAWWLNTDDQYLTTLVETRRPSAWFSDPAREPRTIAFCYRQSPRPLFTWHPSGIVSEFDPIPLASEDAYVELDGESRLLALRVGAVVGRASRASAGFDWKPLFAAAGIESASITQAAGQAAQGAAGAGSAWEARIGAEAVRVEAAADPGRRLEFVVRPLTRPRPVLATERETFQPLLAVLVAGFVLGGLGLVAVLARHNLRLGRGDRRGANRLAVAVTAAETLFVVLGRHWTYEPIALVRVIVLLLGLPLFTGIQTWLYYMALEPAMRRRWPRLLIAWTRLLEGRWRDPLVGRSLILGSATAVVGVAVVPGLLAALATSLQLPVAVPWYQRWSIDGGPAWFLASGAIPTVGPFVAIGSIAFLLIGRIIVGRDLGAWALVFLVCCGINAWMVTFGKPWTMGAPLCIAIPVLVYSTALVILFAKEGLLAGAVSSTVGLALLATPLTSDFTRWYAWRGAVVVLLITAVAYWGFRNVLGRQSAFPTTAL